MFTSVTKQQFKKNAFVYLVLAILAMLFTYCYEQFSYGESSDYMHWMFLAPLIGCLLMQLGILKITWIRHRLSLLLLHSALSIAASACLVKGIIEVSGRTTSIDTPYWYACLIFSTLSLISGFLFQAQKRTITTSPHSRVSRHHTH